MKLYGSLSELVELVIRLAAGQKVTIQSETQGADKTVKIPTMVTNATDKVVLEQEGQTLGNKTLSSPVINNAAINSSTALVVPSAVTPSQTAAGSIVWDSDDNLLTVGDSAGRKTMVDTNSMQTLSQKTLSSPTISSPSISNPSISGAAINSATRIALGSLTTGVGNNHVLISDSNGDLDSEAVLAKVRGGTGADMTNVVFPATGTLVTRDASETLSNKTMGSVTAASGVLAISGTGALTLPAGNNTTQRPASPTAGMIRYNSTDNTFEGYSNGAWAGIGGGGTTDKIFQANHAFVVGNVLYMNGSVYAKAKADVTSTAEVVGVVSRVIDTDNFELTLSGEISGLSSLTPGENYFLSAATAGALSATEPTVVGQVSVPIGVASSATTLYVAPKRGAVVGGANLRTQIGLSNAATTTVQNAGSYDAGSIEGWVYIDATTDYRFHVRANFAKNGAGTDYNLSYQTTGDTPPAGFSMGVTAAGVITATLPSVAGFVSASINFALNAPAVGTTLPLQISGGLVTGPVLGSTSGAAPAAGYVGEVLSVTGSELTTSTINGVTLTLATLPITSAGVWRVDFYVWNVEASSVNAGAYYVANAKYNDSTFTPSTATNADNSGAITGISVTGAIRVAGCGSIPGVVIASDGTKSVTLRQGIYITTGTAAARGRIVATRIA